MKNFISAPAVDGKSTYILIDSTDGDTWCICVGNDHTENARRTCRDLNFGERAFSGTGAKRTAPDAKN